MKKLLKVLITVLCVFGILFVVVAVPFITGVITLSLVGLKTDDYLMDYCGGLIVTAILFVTFMLARSIYNNIDL